MAKQKEKPAPKDPAEFKQQLETKLSRQQEKYKIYLNHQDTENLKEIANKLDDAFIYSEGDKTMEFYSQVDQDIQKAMQTVYARVSKWSKIEKLVKKVDATLIGLTGDEQKSLFVADHKKQLQFAQARSWLEYMHQKQSSSKKCQDPEPKCYEETKYWIDALNAGTVWDKALVKHELERSTLELFEYTEIEKVIFNPRIASLANLINYLRDRLCENPQHQTFESGEDSCHLLPFKTAPHQPPKWMLVELRDKSARSGIYMRGDNLYITGFHNQKNMIYELAESDNLRIIKDSILFGCNSDYSNLVKYDRDAEDLPKEEADRLLLEIIFNLEENAGDVHVLANYDHTQKMDDAERRQTIENVQKALIRKAVVLSEVSRFVNLFIAVNADWNNNIASLTELLLKFMRRWGPMSKKVRSSNSSDVLPDSLQRDLGLKFTSDLIKVLHLVLNTKHPELNKIGRSATAVPNSYGSSDGSSEASGPSDGNGKEAKRKPGSNGNPDPSGPSDGSLGQSGGSHTPSRPSDCSPGQSWLSDGSPGQPRPSDGSHAPPGPSDGSHAPARQTGPSDVCPGQSCLFDGCLEQSGPSAVSSISSVISSIIKSFRMKIARPGSNHPLSHHPLRPVRLYAPSGPPLGPVRLDVPWGLPLRPGCISFPLRPPLALGPGRVYVEGPLLCAYGLYEVPELIRWSASGWVEDLVDRCRLSISCNPILSESVGACASTLSGQPLLEILALHTNLCKVNSIGIYDDRGGVYIYKYKNGEKEQFIGKRDLWLSKHTEGEPYDFVYKLVPIGPSRAMTANAECWLIEADVPIQSSLLSESCATKEMAGGVFKMILDHNEETVDQAKTGIIFARGGFLHISYVVFSNAVRASVKFLLHARHRFHPSNVHGELTLHVGNLPIGFTIFSSQIEDDNCFTPCDVVGEDSRSFILPLTRRVIALPVHSLVRVKGTLVMGGNPMVVDQALVLKSGTTQAQWAMDASFEATICITATSAC